MYINLRSAKSLFLCPKLKTLEWNILNPDQLINLVINHEENKHYLISRLRKRVDQALILINHLKVPRTNYRTPELETFEWWISALMIDPLFFLISRLNNTCSPHAFNIQIN